MCLKCGMVLTMADDETAIPEDAPPPTPAVVVTWDRGGVQVAAINGLDTLSAPTLLKLGLNQINKQLGIDG